MKKKKGLCKKKGRQENFGVLGKKILEGRQI